jgi:hypothetical protein
VAKVKFGALAQDARGKIDGVVYSRNQFGSYVRQKVSPVQPQTARQTLVRERLTTLSKRFSTLISDAQRQAWNAFAKVNPVVDVFGNPQALSGISAYVRLNGVILNGGGTIIDTPPADLSVAGLLSLSVSIEEAGDVNAATSGDVTGNVLTLHFVSNDLVVGQTVDLSGFAAGGAPLNGQSVVVLTQTATTITATFVHADIVATGAGTVTGREYLALGFTPTPLGAGLRLYIWGSQGLNAGRNFFKPNLRFLGVSGAAQTSPYSASAIYDAKFGALIGGTAVGFLVGVCDITKGAVTPGIFQRVVVP